VLVRRLRQVSFSLLIPLFGLKWRLWQVRKFAGGFETGYRDGRTDEASFEGAEGVQPALFRHPRGISTDNGGNLFVADAENHCIRGISAQGEVL